MLRSEELFIIRLLVLHLFNHLIDTNIKILSYSYHFFREYSKKKERKEEEGRYIKEIYLFTKKNKNKDKDGRKL